MASFCVISKNNIPSNVQSIIIYYDDVTWYEDYMIDVYTYDANVIENIPPTVKKIKLYHDYMFRLLKRIPEGCVVTDFNDNVLMS
jgi:hypothetical protein